MSLYTVIICSYAKDTDGTIGVWKSSLDSEHRSTTLFGARRFS